MSSKDKLLASAQKNLEKGQLAKAIKDYQQLVSLDPRDIRHRQKLAELFSRAQMHLEALNEYAAVAKYYSETGFYLKAIAVYKQMQRLDPEQVNIYHRLAELNIKQGLVGNAIAEYRNLVAYYEKKRLYGDAVGVLQKILELEPDNYTVKVRIAEFYVKAGLRENARTEFDTILRALRQTGDMGRLLKLYEFFLPHFPNDPEIKAGFAETLIGCGESEKGLQMLQALVREHPDHGGVLVPLARGYRLKGDFENERLTYQHLLKYVSGDLGLRLAYLQACLDSGEHERALDELEGWADAQSASECQSEVRAAYRRLQELLPGNERVLRGMASLGAGPSASIEDSALRTQAAANPEETCELPAEPEPAEKTEVVAEAPLPGQLDSVPSSSAVEELAPDAWAEEIPLEFLEAAAEQPAKLETAPGEPGSETAADEVAAELELEVELDFELGGIDTDDDHSLSPAVGVADETPCDSPLATSSEQPSSDAVTALPADDLIPGVDASEFTFGSLEPEQTGFDPSVALGQPSGPFGSFPATYIDQDRTLELSTDGDRLSSEIGNAAPLAQNVPSAAECGMHGTPGVQVAMGEGFAEDEDDIIDLDDDLIEEFDEVIEPASDTGEDSTELVFSDLRFDLSTPVDEVLVRDLQLELEEAEFFMQQRLFDDAERVCREILAQMPESSEAMEKLDAVLALRNEPVPQTATDDLFDMSPEIMAGDPFLATEDLTGIEEVDRFRVDGIFTEFKKGIAEQIDGEDTETHYNLGIAYKEMGLLEDAVSEFERAMQSPTRLVDCLTLKGICLAELGAFDRAEEAFRDGLGRDGLSEGERISLYYELGLLYEAWSRPREALESFLSVAATDLFFRDVGEKVGALRQRLGVEPLAGEAGAKGNKDRVSYI